MRGEFRGQTPNIHADLKDSRTFGIACIDHGGRNEVFWKSHWVVCCHILTRLWGWLKLLGTLIQILQLSTTRCVAGTEGQLRCSIEMLAFWEGKLQHLSSFIRVPLRCHVKGWDSETQMPHSPFELRRQQKQGVTMIALKSIHFHNESAKCVANPIFRGKLKMFEGPIVCGFDAVPSWIDLMRAGDLEAVDTECFRLEVIPLVIRGSSLGGWPLQRSKHFTWSHVSL